MFNRERSLVNFIADEHTCSRTRFPSCAREENAAHRLAQHRLARARRGDGLAEGAVARGSVGRRPHPTISEPLRRQNAGATPLRVHNLSIWKKSSQSLTFCFYRATGGKADPKKPRVLDGKSRRTEKMQEAGEKRK